MIYCKKCFKLKNSYEFYEKPPGSGKYYNCCKQCKIENNKKNRKNNPDVYKKFYAKNKIKKLKLCKIRYEKIKNNEDYKNTKKEYSKNNREKINKNMKKYYHTILKINPDFKIKRNLRKRLYEILKNNKNEHTETFIGCSFNVLKSYLEKQFDSNMNWDNYGCYWHIDHIIPCNYFDMTKKDEQFKCFHWSNLRPLNKIENIIKNDKLPKDYNFRLWDGSEWQVIIYAA